MFALGLRKSSEGAGQERQDPQAPTESGRTGALAAGQNAGRRGGGDGWLPAAANPGRTSLFSGENRRCDDGHDIPGHSDRLQTNRNLLGRVRGTLVDLSGSSEGQLGSGWGKNIQAEQRSLTEPRALAELCSITLYGHGPASTMAAHCLSG